MKILLIEDNPGDARLVREMLREADGNFTINVAEKLGTGLEFLASQDVDVVLADLNLPDSHGLETLARLQRQFSHLPIVIMTGSDDEAVGVQAVKLGAQDYLVKGQVDGRLLRRTFLYALERKKTDEALKEKEQFLERLAELNPAVISVTDLTNDQQIYSSKSGLVLLGYNPEEIKDVDGFSASILYPGDFERMVAANAELKRANDNHIRDIEVRARAADGEWRWFQLLYVIFKRDHQGLPLQAMSVARDITKLKEMEQLLAAQERLATLGKVAGSIAHELRNPLAVIDSSIFYLTSQYQKRGKDALSDDKVRAHLERMRHGIQRSEAIIKSLLDLTQPREPETRRLDPRTVIRQLISDCELPVTLKVELDFPEQEVWIYADPVQLDMAFGNIITNARQAMDSRGRLDVRIRKAEGQAEIAFTDTGVGIPPENLPKIFEPLFTTKAQGIGLGLAIAKMITERHHGTIDVQSEPGRGTTITFRLPAVK